MDLRFQLILFEYIVSLKWSCNIQFWNNFCLEITIYQHWHVHSDRLTGPLMLISLVHLAQQTSINYFYLVYPRSKFRCTCTCHSESDPLLPSQPMKQTVEVVTIIPWSTCTCMSGHEIAPNTVANATKIIVLATKIQKLVAKLATRTLWVLYILPWCFLQLNKALK